ncbi:MAG: sigma-70 family RNA polymerase sigma factor [Bacteroidales bacterium]|nr:sigma-70 family RNA polymerase sigma factor [Bacteroidales bacterium]
MNEQTFISLAEGLRHIAVAEAQQYISDDDVEDVAQEVMLRIWERRQDLSPELKMLRPYAATLSRNICHDRYKFKRRHPLLRLIWYNDKDDEHEAETPSFDTPQRRMEIAEATDIYRTAISKLLYNWQRILTMRGEQEMDYSEIALILGTTESSVRGTLCKAKKKMLELIKQNI